MTNTTTTVDIQSVLKQLGVAPENQGTSTGNTWFGSDQFIASYSPVDGELIGKVSVTTPEDYAKVLETASEAFKQWRIMPAPQRGEVVRQFGEELRRLKEPLGQLVSYEMGKSLQEGLGEVQEMIDICDFAVTGVFVFRFGTGDSA